MPERTPIHRPLPKRTAHPAPAPARAPNEVVIPIEQLEDLLEIDEFRLEDVCARHSGIFYKVAKQTALAISRRDAAYQAVKEANSRADAKIRHDAEVSDEKVTDKTVEAKRVLEPNVMAAVEQHAQLKLQADLLIALKESFDQ